MGFVRQKPVAGYMYNCEGCLEERNWINMNFGQDRVNGKK